MASALSSELVATKAERPVWSAATAWAPLLGLPAAAGLLAAAAAGATDGTYLPGERGVWPAGYRSPLAALGLALTPGLFLALTVVLVLLYLILLRTAGRLPFAAVAACLACAYALLAAGPPLLSRDVFGYIGYARMVAVHGLNPYVQTPSAMAGDPVLPLMGWPPPTPPHGPPLPAPRARPLPSFPRLPPTGPSRRSWRRRRWRLCCSSRPPQTAAALRRRGRRSPLAPTPPIWS